MRRRASSARRCSPTPSAVGRAGLVSRQGSEGRFDWSIAVAPVHAPWAEIKSKANWRLNHVRVTVAWDKNRSIVLDTLKLGRAHE